jgi:hypothetical protein
MQGQRARGDKVTDNLQPDHNQVHSFVLVLVYDLLRDWMPTIPICQQRALPLAHATFKCGQQTSAPSFQARVHSGHYRWVLKKNRKFRMLRSCHLTQVPRANAVVAIAAVLATAVQHRAREYGARFSQAVPEQTSHDVIFVTLQMHHQHALSTNTPRNGTCEWRRRGAEGLAG